MDNFFNFNFDFNFNFNFKYIIIIIILTALIAKINPIIILSLACSALVLFIFSRSHDHNIDNLNKILTDMNLQDNTSIILNSNVVNFIINYKDYYDINKEAFRTFIKLLNNLVKVEYEIATSMNYHMDHDVALSMKPKILNTYHSFLYNLPHMQSNLKKFHEGSKELLYIVNIILDSVNAKVLNRAKNESLTVSTKFHYRSHPKAANQSNLNSTYHV
jgi:hypothetical protein